MAQIDLKQIKRMDKERNSIHDKVYSTYTVFEHCGSKYVQIDMFGRSDREMPGKISQTLQLDEEAAEFLVKLLVKEFGISL